MGEIRRTESEPQAASEGVLSEELNRVVDANAIGELFSKELGGIVKNQDSRLAAAMNSLAETGGHVASGSGLKRWELDLFLHTVWNVNDNLRLQMMMAGGLMAACITMLNVASPQRSGAIITFANDIDRFVFIPAMVSVVISYIGLEHHWNYKKRKASPPEEMEELYNLVAFKFKMLHMASAFLCISAILLGLFILVEFG